MLRGRWSVGGGTRDRRAGTVGLYSDADQIRSRSKVPLVCQYIVPVSKVPLKGRSRLPVSSKCD